VLRPACDALPGPRVWTQNAVCAGDADMDGADDACPPCLIEQCDDGNLCNGMETCSASTGQCVPGSPVNCNDGTVCNGTNFCDPATGLCHPGTPLNCNDGQFCTADSCDPVIGCVNEPIENCQGNVPTVSHWGLAILGLLLLVASKLGYKKRIA